MVKSASDFIKAKLKYIATYNPQLITGRKTAADRCLNLLVMTNKNLLMCFISKLKYIKKYCLSRHCFDIGKTQRQISAWYFFRTVQKVPDNKN
jgi:hypothetical protein